jgi:futalosine hydrolase
MKVLVTAATMAEIQPFYHYLTQHGQPLSDHSFNINNRQITVLIAGIGMMHTAYSLGRYFATSRPDIAIQAGIAGSFNHQWELGQVVQVKKELLADLGAEDDAHFKDLFDIGLWQPDQFPFENKWLVNNFANGPHLPALPEATGITVNLVSGSAATIQRLEQTYAPDLESMEGAAFHYACLMEKIPFLQLRSISNYVEIRDKSKWNIPLAVKELNNQLRALSLEL